MIRFGSMSAFVSHLAKLPAEIAVAEKAGLTTATHLLRDKAKESLGEYQDAVGPLPAWAELAASTQAERSLQGYTPNDPLLRSGALRDSIQAEVTDDPIGRVYTENEHAAELEFGTVRMPPRPFMGGAAFRHGEEAADEVGKAVAGAFAGTPVPAKGQP